MAAISKEYWYVNTLAKNIILRSILIYEAKGIKNIYPGSVAAGKEMWQNCDEISVRFWLDHFFHEHSLHDQAYVSTEGMHTPPTESSVVSIVTGGDLKSFSVNIIIANSNKT